MQSESTLRPAVQIVKHPIHPMLIPIPIVCFIGAMVTDIAYATTAEMMWADFSSWLLAIGLIIMWFKEREIKEFLGRSYFGKNKKDDKYLSFAEEQKAYNGLGA